jgi:CubicO group peptidase (beta-lactamase class C family)
MAQHGELSLDDPIQKYLPSAVKIPERDAKQVARRRYEPRSPRCSGNNPHTKG